MLQIVPALPGDALYFVKFEEDADARRFIIPYTFEQHLLNLTDSSKVYLRIVDELPIGFVLLALDDDGRSVEFRRIVVGPKGKGIGQRTISLMEQFCRSHLGRSRIWLDVFEDNHRGRHIYEKLGYARFGESTHDGRRLLLYEKQLSLT